MTPHLAPVFVIAPDSFKGSLSAEQVAQAIGRGLNKAIPTAEIRLCPLADGGEGTLEVLLHAGGEKQIINVRGASGAIRPSAIGILPDGSAVIESAEIVGITDEAGMRLPVEQRSTLGIGDAIGALLDTGCRRFLIGLGGSSTNDGGIGMLTALGIKFLDIDGKEVIATPEQLPHITNIDISDLDPRIKDTQMIVMSDVNNPLCGPEGATAVFGPQKGVSPAQVPLLDRTLSHVAQLLEDAFGHQTALKPGAGAAGGLGFALLLLGAQFQSGAETVIDRIGLDAALEGADWLITGEGRSDKQTLHGKGPFIAAKHATQRHIPTTLLSGGVDIDSLEALQAHFSGCFSITFGPTSLADAIVNAEMLLCHSAEQMARLWLNNKSAQKNA